MALHVEEGAAAFMMTIIIFAIHFDCYQHLSE
jgi:hypothetical protein